MPLPTLRQPFANFLPTFSANPFPSPSFFREPEAQVQKNGLTAFWDTESGWIGVGRSVSARSKRMCQEPREGGFSKGGFCRVQGSRPRKQKIRGGGGHWAEQRIWHSQRHGHESDKKKPININMFGGTVFGTNRNRPWDKPGPVPGTKWDPSLRQTGRSLVELHSKIAILSRLSLGGGSSLGRSSRKGRQKNVYVFSVCWFFSPPSNERRTFLQKPPSLKMPFCWFLNVKNS